MTDVSKFVDVVRRYCEWVERPSQSDDALMAHQTLTELQKEAIRLPDIECEDEYVDAEFKEDWKAVRDRLSFFPVDVYWKVFDVFADPEEPVCCSLADDLADIYSDLKEGLYFFDQGNESEAVWRWRFSITPLGEST